MKKFKNIIKSFSIAMLLIIGIASRAQTNSIVIDADSDKKVAILPITYVGDGNPVKIQEMKFRLQNISYLFLKEKAVELKFQDPSETNALLRKNGVNEETYRQFTPKELADILKVEYILTGMVMQESKGVNHFKDTRRENNNKSNEGERHTQSRTVQDLTTQIDLTVYNNKGESIYSKSRQSILSDVDAYKNGIHYVLKRSPLYKK